MLQSSDSEVDDEIVLMLYNEEHTNIENFQNVIENYTDAQFRRHFRLSRNTLQIVVNSYIRHCTEKKKIFLQLTPKIQVYMFVWYLANTETFRQLGDRFGVSRSYAYYVIFQLAVCMANEAQKFVKWPSLVEQKIIADHFKAISNIRNVIGAIDCTHIEIPKPKEHQGDYFNRKKYFSIQMQATVDDRKRFTSVFVGEPGSMHDARVLRRSDIFKSLCERREGIILHRGILLGDLPYPKIYSWLIPPYKRNERLSDQKQQFNKRHSSTRIIVEQAFGLLKSRFRRLQKFGNIKKRLIILLVISACGLHNLCIDHDDKVERRTNLAQSDAQSNSARQRGFATRQDELLSEMIEENVITHTR